MKKQSFLILVSDDDIPGRRRQNELLIDTMKTHQYEETQNKKTSAVFHQLFTACSAKEITFSTFRTVPSSSTAVPEKLPNIWWQ